MTAQAITAITDLLLAGEAFFLAGRMSRTPKDRLSAAWYLSGVLLLLGVAAFPGGIDHGFFEPANMPSYLIQRSDWIVLGTVTFCLLITTAKQIFPPKVQRVGYELHRPSQRAGIDADDRGRSDSVCRGGRFHALGPQWPLPPREHD
jgi:hypothetical protein